MLTFIALLLYIFEIYLIVPSIIEIVRLHNTKNNEPFKFVPENWWILVTLPFTELTARILLSSANYLDIHWLIFKVSDDEYIKNDIEKMILFNRKKINWFLSFFARLIVSFDRDYKKNPGFFDYESQQVIEEFLNNRNKKFYKEKNHFIQIQQVKQTIKKIPLIYEIVLSWPAAVSVLLLNIYFLILVTSMVIPLFIGMVLLFLWVSVFLIYIFRGDKISDYITLYNYIFNDHKEAKEYKSPEKFEKKFDQNF